MTWASAIAPFGFTENRKPVRRSRSGSSNSVNESSDPKSASRRSCAWRMARGSLSYAHTPTYSPSGLASSRTTVRSVPARPSTGSDCVRVVIESALSHTASASVPSSRIAAEVCVTRASHWGSCARAATGASAHTMIPAAPRRLTGCTLPLRSSSGRCCALEHQPDEPGRHDKDRLRDLSGSQEERQGHERDDDRRQVHERPPTEDHSGAGDGPCSCRRDTIDECLHLPVLRHAMEVRRDEDDHQIYGQEHSDRGEGRAGESRDEVADECHRDDHWPRRDHRHRHGIDELPLGEPMELLYHPAVQERHDREPAAEDE